MGEQVRRRQVPVIGDGHLSRAAQPPSLPHFHGAVPIGAGFLRPKGSG
jgi:hypothetical protein